MLYQFEITTYCNLKCFYCPSEFLEKKHMDFKLYKMLIDKISQESTIKLQGTGEPLLHPNFLEFARYAKEKGLKTQIITNGTIQITKAQSQYLDSIGFSIDTLDKKVSKKTGRISIQKVLDNLKKLHKIYPYKVIIFSVYYGQNLSSIKRFAQKYKIPHIIQRIQHKSSYQAKYKTKPKTHINYKCSYINQDKMIFYFVDGTLALCPYMIHVKDVLNKEDILKAFSIGKVPKCCQQCDELTNNSRLLTC